MTLTSVFDRFEFAKPPRGRQGEVIEQSWHRPIAALLCRPGTGKSKLGIDTAGLQYLQGTIEAFLVVSPEGVHEQWVLEAIPTHMSPLVPWVGGYYSSTETRVLAFRTLTDKLFCKGKSLRVLSMTFDGIQTVRGKKLARELASRYKTLVFIDESHRVANQKTAGYKSARELLTYAASKRIATGTLLRQNPFAAYGQFELMGNGLLGFGSLAAFKSMYAKMLDKDDRLYQHVQQQFRAKTGKTIEPRIVAKDEDGKPVYRNLADLRRRLDKWSYFLTLADVSGKEPIVNQSTIYVDLSPAQARMYRELTQIGITQTATGPLIADGSLALAIRLAQVCGGFVPNEDNPLALPIEVDDNPRIRALVDYCEDIAPEKVMIWARYKPELKAIAVALAAQYGEGSVAEYHGDINSKDRATNKARFRDDPTCRFFVGQQQVGGTGLDGLQGAASEMVFYSNTYSYLDREQCIARLARTNGADVVNVKDMMSIDTIDEDIVKCMQAAQDVSEAVLLKRLNRVS